MSEFVSEINEQNPFGESAFRHRLTGMKESGIRSIWFLTAIVAVLTVSFILLFLLMDGIPIFEEVGLTHFIGGETWNPTGVARLLAHLQS